MCCPGRGRRGCLAACLLLVLLVRGRAPAAEIVIGMSAAFTGPSRGLGIEFYRGAMAWFTEVNRTGIDGNKIVLRAYDDGYNPEPAIANTRKLITEDKALLLFGYVGTPTVTRVLPLLKLHEKSSVYLFCPFTGAEPMRQGPFADQVYNLRASYRDETAGLVNHFLRIGRKRIAVFYQIDAYGRSGWDGVRRALERKGLKMCAEATYRRGAHFLDRMTAQVAILERGKPDAVICVGAYAACAAFIRDARDAGLTVPIANLSFVGSENLLGLLGEHGRAKGTDYTEDLINSQVVPCYTQTDLPAVKLYRNLMNKHRPSVPVELTNRAYLPVHYSFTSLEGFLGARLVVEVLRKLGPSLDRRRLAQAADSLENVDLGLLRKVSFGPGKRQAMSKIYYTVARGGVFVPLVDWSRWKK
jgi:ABC-type branched-subunit amino acid transport system substrate-binding protein